MELQKGFWNYKSIILTFAVSDLRVRYKNSALGFFWTFLEPLLMLGVLYLVFSNIFKNDIENFPLYLLLGIIMWTALARGTQISIDGILSRTGMFKQIHIPNYVPGLSATLTSTIMLSFEMIIFGIFMVFFQFIPSITILLLPLILLLEFLLILGLALPLSVLNVKFRDMRFIWNVVLQAGFFVTPIFYKLDMLPENIQAILQYSPMVQILLIAQEVTLYGQIPSSELVLQAIGTTAIVFTIGCLIYLKFQKGVVELL